MNTEGLTLVTAIRRKMAYLTQRQEVLAHNVANADTPGYHARELAPFEFRNEVRARFLVPQATLPGHIRLTSPTEIARNDVERVPFETAPAGNSVILDEQMLKISDNNHDYQLVLNLYRKQVGMLKTAIGSPSGV